LKSFLQVVVADQLGDAKHGVHLTQEFMSEMLGVRRTSVTEVAQKLQEAGFINYSRGVINILDLDALKARSCECFETLREQNVI
jgi:Mn-dependent DtxR family transcriptional regulator